MHKDLKAFLGIFYADDLTYATTSKNHRTDIKRETPKKLEKFNLHVNASKTEEGEAPDKRQPPRPPPPPAEDPKDKILWSELDWLLPPKMTPQTPHTRISNFWEQSLIQRKTSSPEKPKLGTQ